MADNEDPYQHISHSGLKIKGSKVKKPKKKKKKKNKAGEILEQSTSSTSQLHNSDDEKRGIKKTAAELAFEKSQEKRATERILKKASKTHKQRVEELNEYLGGLSEHYDIQKVSWTK